jgi:pimeloyl-ACP methyl ester carboxylesterase
MTTEDIAGLRLGIDRTGSGALTALLVHGGFCDRHDWKAQIDVLEPHCRVVAFDMPGHGESALPAEATVAALGQAVRAVIQHCGGERVVLIGHSLGVDVILEAWRQSPAGIAGFVLIEGGLVADGDADAAVSAVREKIDAVGLQAFLTASFAQMFVPSSDPQLRSRVLQRLTRLDSRFAQEIVLSKVRWDASEAARVLATVNVPMLVLQSTYFDAAFQRYSLPPGMTTPWTELVAQQVRDAQLRTIPGVGHFPQMEAPHIVNELILGFVRRLRAPE